MSDWVPTTKAELAAAYMKWGWGQPPINAAINGYMLGNVEENMGWFSKIKKVLKRAVPVAATVVGSIYGGPAGGMLAGKLTSALSKPGVQKALTVAKTGVKIAKAAGVRSLPGVGHVRTSNAANLATDLAVVGIKAARGSRRRRKKTSNATRIGRAIGGRKSSRRSRRSRSSRPTAAQLRARNNFARRFGGKKRKRRG